MRWTLVLTLLLIPSRTVWAQPSQRAVEGAKDRLRLSVEGAEGALKFANGVFRQLEALDPRQADEELTERLGGADQAVRLARGVLDAPDAALADIQEAERSTTAAAGELARLRRDLPARLGAVQRAQRTLISEIQASNRTARRLLDDSRLQNEEPYRRLLHSSQRVPYVDREVPVPELERLAADLRQAVEACQELQRGADARAAQKEDQGASATGDGKKPRARDAGAEAPSGRARTQQRPAGQQVDAVGDDDGGAPALPDTPSRDLRQAARALLAGDYERSLRIVQSVREEDDRSRATCLLLETAANHALYLLGGETDKAQLAAIESKLGELLALMPELDLSGSDLSPRFVRLVQQQRAELP